ncbi:TetR family transcriptional regulator [Agromyces luteolus]|nr:TetR family transcriptional regulator [Agromyces luteolus]
MRKRLAIMDAAKQSFLAVGFTDTNLDDVAATAGVSKMTVYSHFSSKQNLFVAIMNDVIDVRSADGHRLEVGSSPADFGATLTAIATELVETVRDPEVVGFRRVLVQEQSRHPGLAAAWRKATVVATTAELEQFFASARRQGFLVRRVEPRAVASQFLWMLIGEELDRALLDPGHDTVTPAVRAREVVATVLGAYAASVTD